jgi:hypothetical protein
MIKEFYDEDNALPASFSGSYNGEGLAFSVDGENWHTIMSSTGSNSTSVWQQHVINLDQVAAAAELSYGESFYLKFQQYDNYYYSSDGIAIDQVVVTAAGE